MNWAKGKYSRGVVKMHTLMDLRGSIPIFIHITDGKYHDVNALDELEIVSDAIYVMDKAYIDFKRLYRLNQVESFFVVRAKENLKFRAVTSKKVDKTIGLRCDQIIRLKVKKSKTQYPEKLRRIKYYDEEKNILLVFLTNNFELAPMEIATLYKHRWQIEVFFRWIKQNLQIKTLWGHSMNAVQIHLWVAICTYLIVAHLKHQIRSPYSVYELMQILGISAFDKTPINELITKEKNNKNLKEQPSLFDNNDL